MNLDKILLSRPYSWMWVILIGLATNVLVTGSLQLDITFFLDTFVSIWMWFTGLSMLEYFHNKHEYGQNNVKKYPIIMASVLAAFSAYFNILTLPIIGLFLLGVVLYSSKTNRLFLGRASFLFRAISELSLILIILLLHNSSIFSPTNLLFALSIYFLTASRNLLGDLRDVKVDENTLAVYNKSYSQVLSIAFAVVPIFIFMDLMVTLPVIVMIFIIGFFGQNKAYLGHRMAMICTIFFVGNYIFSLLQVSTLVSNLVFLGVILNFTYNKVPRKIEICKQN